MESPAIAAVRADRLATAAGTHRAVAVDISVVAAVVVTTAVAVAATPVEVAAVTRAVVAVVTPVVEDMAAIDRVRRRCNVVD